VAAVTAGLSEYEIRHLVEHLHAASNGAAVDRLLRLEDAEDGANAWFAAQDALGNVDGYLRDLRLALDLAGPQALGLGTRYTLMMSSVRSAAASVPAKLLARAVEERVVTIDEALAQVERTTDPGLAADTLIAVAPYAPKARHAELRLLAARIDDDGARARAVAGLAGTLVRGELAELLSEIECLAPGLDDSTIAWAVAAFAPRIGGQFAPRLLVLARRVRTGVLRAQALVALAPIIKRNDRQAVFEEALDGVLSDEAPMMRPVLATVLATMPADRSERIRAGLVRDALANIDYAPDVVQLARDSLRSDEQMLAIRRAVELDPSEGGLEEMVALAPETPEAELGELLEIARGIDPAKRDDRTMARLVRTVAPHLSPAVHEQALAIVDDLGESAARCFALASLGERNRAVAEAARLADPTERTNALSGLGEPECDAPVQATDELRDRRERAELLLDTRDAARVPQALELARELSEPWRRVELLLKAIALTDNHESLVHETLTLIAKRAGENFNPAPSGQLDELGRYLPASLAREAIDTALQLDEQASLLFTGAVVKLAPHLPTADLHLLVEGSGRLSPAKRGRVLRALAGSVPAELHPTILDRAAELDVEDIRGVVDACAERIAPSLLEPMLQLCRPIGHADAALTTATDLAVAAHINPVPGFVFEGAVATGELNPIVDLLSDDQLAAALGAVDAMSAGSYERAMMLGALASVFPAERLGELIKRARGNSDALAGVIRGGAERFPEELVGTLARRAKALPRRVERFSALAALAPRLSPETRDRLRSGCDDLNVLLALVDGAEPAVRQELLTSAAETANLRESDAAYVDACRRISHYLDGDARTEALEKALSYAYVVEDAEARGQLLDDVLSDLAQVDPARVLDQLGALDRHGQQRMLPWLLQHLDDQTKAEVVRRAEALEPEDARADALAALARAESMTPESVALIRHAQQRLTGLTARVKVLAALLPTSPGSIAPELRELTGSHELAANGRAIALGALMSQGPDDARVADFAGMLAARRSPMARERLDIGAVFHEAADSMLLWWKLMRVLADHPRSTILDVLSAFADEAAAQGHELSVQLIEAIGDSVRWWK
jgi:hypothetical protein